MIDAIAEAEGISVNNIRSKALFGKDYIGDVPVMLAKPQTFMNVSSESVGPLVSYFKIPLNQVLLMYDNMDLPFAKLQLLPKGGHGGHNGILCCYKRCINGKGMFVGLTMCYLQGPLIHNSSGNCLNSFCRGTAWGKECIPGPLPLFPIGGCHIPCQGIYCQIYV